MTDVNARKRLWTATTLITLTLVLSTAAHGQETGNPPVTPPDQQTTELQANNSAQNTDQSSASQLANPPTPAYPVDTQIHPAGRTTPWLDSRNPLHLGPISLASLDYVSVYDQFYPSAGGPSDIERLNLLRANIVFDKVF